MWFNRCPGRRPFFSLLLLIAGLFISGRATAQETVKTYNNASASLFLNTEYYLPSGSFFFGEASLRHRVNFPDEDINGLPLHYVHATLGYEQKLSTHWAAGFSARLITERPFNSFYSRGYFNHIGKIGSIEFLQQLSMERVDFTRHYDKPQGRMGLLLSLSRNFAVKSGYLRPVLSCELYTLHGWALSPHEIYKNRRIDQTLLKAELAYLFNRNFSLSLFFTRDTTYLLALGGSTPTGNLPDYKLNSITPVFGIRAHLLIRHKDLSPDTPLRYLPY